MTSIHACRLSMRCMAWKNALLGLVLFGCFGYFVIFKASLFSVKHSTSRSLYNSNTARSQPKTREPQQSFGDVETFVLFTGHARSGHSIVGAMLDAHPQMVVANEFNIPQHWQDMKRIAQHRRLPLRNVILQQLMKSSRKATLDGNRRVQREGGIGSSYLYYIPGQWQGSFKGKIKVIGDKKGTNAAVTMLRDPEFFKRLQNTVGLPLKFIHVVRNPFDNIATMLLRKLDSRFEEETKLVNKTELLNEIMRNFMKIEKGSARIRQMYPVLNVPSHDVVLRTKETLQKICEFLQVTCTADYLDACASIVHTEVSVTRNRVVWTDDQKRWLLNEMQKYSYLRHFTFEDPE